MHSLRSGVAVAALVAMWSSAAFGFNLFGSSKAQDKPKPAAQTQQQQQDADGQNAPNLAKTLAANLDSEIDKARTQRALGDYKAAAHALAQMMLVAPDDVRVVGEYGKVLVAMGRADDAIEFLKRALELNNNDWTLYSAIGAAFDQKNQFDDARIAYQRGLQLKPDGAALLNNYAMSRMLAGDLPAAQGLIARAQAAGNDPKIAHNAALMANLRGPKLPQTAHVPTPAHAPAAKPVAAKVEQAKVEQAKLETPKVVKTDAGRVMMQAVPKDPLAGPVTPSQNTAAATQAATTAPRDLASAVAPVAPATAAAPRATPDLRAASD